MFYLLKIFNFAYQNTINIIYIYINKKNKYNIYIYYTLIYN